MSYSNIQEKYDSLRDQLLEGDIVLFKGSNRIMPTLISFFDDAYYTHAGVIFEAHQRKMIIDSNAKGVRPDFLSLRMKEGYGDFCIIRPVKPELMAVYRALQRGDTGTKYDFLLLLRIAIIKKLGINLTGLGSKDRDVCSEFARFYSEYYGNTFSKNLITPHDFVRLVGNDDLFVKLYDDRIIKTSKPAKD
jgi:hypothetical protein